jgi:protein gp37
MGLETAIQWCDATFNPWRGCQKVSAGCKYCYAATLVNGRLRGDFAKQRVVLGDRSWREPKMLDREAGGLRERRRVFCASLADVFEDWTGPMLNAQGDERWYKHERTETGNMTPETMDDVRRRLFELIDATPHLDWLILTKRPENIRRFWPETFPLSGGFTGEARQLRSNVWLGTSVEDQEQGQKRWDQLQTCRDLSPVLFWSVEPMLESIDAHEIWRNAAVPDWVIAGGESGFGARPCNIAWIRSLRDQCSAAGVPFFLKQLGANPYMAGSGGERFGWPESMGYEVKNLTTWMKPTDKKGGDPSEWPDDLQDCRAFPATVRI